MTTIELLTGTLHDPKAWALATIRLQTAQLALTGLLASGKFNRDLANDAVKFADDLIERLSEEP